MFSVNYFIYGYKKTVFPDVEIFLYKCITNSNLAKIDAIYCVMTSTLFYCPHSERRALLASQTSLTSLGRNGRNIPASLALESKELVKSVRAILDMDCKFSEFFSLFKIN